MRVFAGLLCRGCGLTDKLFERPGLGIIRQYKNDGKKKNNPPKHLLFTKRLVGVKEATHTILDTEHVVVHSVDVLIGVGGVVDDARGIEAREVEGTSGLKLTSIEAEGIEEELGARGGGAVGGVIVEGHGGKVGISELVVSHISTVDLELELVARGADHGDRRSITSGDVLDGVVKVELLNLRVGRDRLLNLGHDHVLGLGSEHFTLLGVEVRVVRVDLPLTRGSLGTPSDAKLDIVVLEGDERESRLPVLTEGEAERVELGGAGAVVEAGGHRLGGGERRQGRGDQGRVGGVLLINHLTTDEKLHLGDHISPVVCERVGRETITRDGHEVHIVEHVTLALEADGGHTVVRDVALNDLTLDSLGEVRMTLVGRTEKADFGLTDEVHILSTDSDELGDTTRHLL
jgi:hypothetical protein